MSTYEHCPECGAELADPAVHSDAARRRFFGIIKETFENMPDNWRALLPSRMHLRKYVLVRIGHCDTTVTNCGSQKAALEVAALAKRLDTFAVCDVRGSVITVSTARSIRKRGCPKAVFMPLTEKAYAHMNQMFGYDVESGEMGKAA